jgi:hypothetical protein
MDILPTLLLLITFQSKGRDLIFSTSSNTFLVIWSVLIVLLLES